MLERHAWVWIAGLAIGGGLLPTAGCSGRKATWSAAPEDQAAEAQARAAAEEAAALVARGERAWPARASSGQLQAAIEAWTRAAELDPDHVEVRVWLTRAHVFRAEAFLRDDEVAYLEALDEAVRWGEKALIAASPEFGRLMRDGKKVEQAIRVVPDTGVPAMYWYATALGKWAQQRGLAVILGQKNAVKAVMDRVLDVDPTYFYGGPHRYFGAFYAIAPSFAGGDLEKSKVHFKKSLEIAPDNVATRVLWASELAVRTQDEALFDRLIAEALDTPDDAIPALEPETQVEKEKARDLKSRKDELF